MTRNVTYAPGVPSSIADTLIYKLETEETKNKRYVCMSMYLCLLYPKAFYIMLWCYLCKHYFSTHLYIYYLPYTRKFINFSYSTRFSYVCFICMYVFATKTFITYTTCCLSIVKSICDFSSLFFFFNCCCCCLYVLLTYFFAIVKFT